MDFFYSQHSLTTVQWMLRTFLVFFFLIFVVKCLGQRFLSQLRLLDIIIALSIGNIIAHPLSDHHLGLKGSLVTTTFLAFLYILFIYISNYVPFIQKWFNAAPLILIKNGNILHRNLRKARLTLDVLIVECRKSQITDLSTLALVMFEADGTFSFILKSEEQTVTAKDLNIKKQAFSYPVTIIKEGKVLKEVLEKQGVTETWVKQQLHKQFNVVPTNVLLATINEHQQLQIFVYS